MDTPKWLKDKDSWTLSSTFLTGPTKTPQPQVGDTFGPLKIIGAWVNRNRILKAYQVQCNCGTIMQYVLVNNLKYGNSSKCRNCSTRVLDGTRVFKEKYPLEIAEKLIMLHKKSYDRRQFENGPTFYEPWKSDYIAFAEYILALPNFDRYPEYDTDRIDNTKGYVPGNIRFVPRKTNARNKVNSRFCIHEGKSITRMDLIEKILGPEYKKSPKAQSFVYRWLRTGTPVNTILVWMHNDPNSYIWDYAPVKWFFFEHYPFKSKKPKFDIYTESRPLTRQKVRTHDR